MSEHLIRAARARHEDATRRANTALLTMAKTDEPVTFAAVARQAGVSTDFLYNTPTLRARITELRQQPLNSNLPQPPTDAATSTSAIRALSSQLKQLRRRHREELQAAQAALAVAHGENLALRRRLAERGD